MATTGISSYTVSVQKGSTVLNATSFAALSVGDPVTVTVQAQWGTVGIRALGIISAGKQVTGAAVMRKEG